MGETVFPPDEANEKHLVHIFSDLKKERKTLKQRYLKCKIHIQFSGAEPIRSIVSCVANIQQLYKEDSKVNTK